MEVLDRCRRFDAGDAKYCHHPSVKRLLNQARWFGISKFPQGSTARAKAEWSVKPPKNWVNVTAWCHEIHPMARPQKNQKKNSTSQLPIQFQVFSILPCGVFLWFFLLKKSVQTPGARHPFGALPQSLATSFTQTPYIELQVLLRPYWPYHMVPYLLWKMDSERYTPEMGEEWYTCFHMSHTVCCLPNTSCCYNQNICIYIYIYWLSSNHVPIYRIFNDFPCR